MVTMSPDWVRTEITAFKESMNLSDEELIQLLRKNPKKLFSNRKDMNKIGRVLVHSLQFEWKEALTLVQSRPLIISGTTNDLLDMRMQLAKAGFKGEEIRRTLSTLPALLTLSWGNFKSAFAWLSERIGQEATRKAFLDQPMLFTVDFANFFIPKVEHLRKLKFSEVEVMEIFKQVPAVFVR